MLLGRLNGKLIAIHGGGGARVGASQAIFDLHVGLEVVGFWPFFGGVSVPHSLPMAIAAKRGVNLRIWDAVGRYGARGRCLGSRSHS